MESASLARWKCVNALSGTALLIAVVLAVLADDPNPDVVAFALDASAFVGGVRTPADGVYITEVVVAFDPADADPEDENEFVAPGPEVPDDAFA